jgi:hypothetical protein
MFSEQSIRSADQPLQQGEFHPKCIGSLKKLVGLRLRDVERSGCKMFYPCNCLRLSPGMRTYNIRSENAQVHQTAYGCNDQPDEVTMT